MISCLNIVLILVSVVLGAAFGYRDSEETLWGLQARIKELGEKSTQLLVFLSFAIAAVVVLGSEKPLKLRKEYEAMTSYRGGW